MSENQNASPENFPPNPETQAATRDFRLDEVLSAVTGTNFLETTENADPDVLGRMADLLGFVTREDKVEVHQLPRLSDEVRADIMKKHPLLASVVEAMPVEPPADASHDKQVLYRIRQARWEMETRTLLHDKMGDHLTLSRLSNPQDHQKLDPAKEFEAMGGTVIKTKEELARVLALGNSPEGSVGPLGGASDKKDLWTPPPDNDPVARARATHEQDMQDMRALGLQGNVNSPNVSNEATPPEDRITVHNYRTGESRTVDVTKAFNNIITHYNDGPTDGPHSPSKPIEG